jgi:hypothetical protein
MGLCGHPLLHNDGDARWLYLTTIVRFHSRLGRLYFHALPVKAMHRVIVPRDAAGDARRAPPRASVVGLDVRFDQPPYRVERTHYLVIGRVAVDRGHEEREP